MRHGPFSAWPVYDTNEERALLDVLHSGRWWSGAQAFHNGSQSDAPTKAAAFESEFAAFLGAKFGLGCASGTAALEVALKAAGVGPGDEVIVPPYTFLATASAPLLLGAVPVFCDIEPATLNLDPAKLEGAITGRTRAIIPVHFAGLPADMDRILATARARELFVLEDAAHAHGAASRGKKLGTLGDAGIFSFQGSKNMTAGEGGLIVTDQPEIAELCSSYIWGGRLPSRPWYEHYRLGWNYRMTEFQAAILSAQLKRLPLQLAARMRNGLRLNEMLAGIPGVSPLAIPPWVDMHGFHLYIFRVDSRAFGVSRDQLVAALEAEGIPCSAGYSHPLYRNPMFLHHRFHGNGAPLAPPSTDFLAYADACPEAERACREVVWIEHRVLLSPTNEVEDVAHAINKIHECRREFEPAMAG